MERLKVYLFGLTVHRLGRVRRSIASCFSEFDLATDRIPVEGPFGLAFAWLAKFVGGVYRNRRERSARLNLILVGIIQYEALLRESLRSAHPSKNQQSIGVIREEVDRSDSALRRSCRVKLLGRGLEEIGGICSLRLLDACG
jgi:hypothetical protein